MSLSVLTLGPMPALAAEGEAALRDLVERQSSEIEGLKARLAALEAAVGRPPIANHLVAGASPPAASTVINWGRTVPEFINDSVQVPLGAIAAPDRGYGYGLELGGVRGPLWSFLEAGRRTIDAAGGEVETNAWAVSAGWLLIGEGAPYSARGGTFVRFAPNAPLSKGGIGSLELIARYQGLDNRAAPLGGEGREATLGATWRLEDWMRVMLNLSLWEVRHRSGPYGGPDDGATLASRLQLSF